MRTVPVAAILVVLAGLGCSACGSGGKHATTTIRHAVPVAQRLPIRRSGTGSQSLGTFAMHGWLYEKATCVGTGKFGVYLTATSSKNAEGASPRCLNSSRKPTFRWSSNFGTNVHRARIDIRAPAHMKWSIIIFEGPVDAGPKALNVW